MTNAIEIGSHATDDDCVGLGCDEASLPPAPWGDSVAVYSKSYHDYLQEIGGDATVGNLRASIKSVYEIPDADTLDLWYMGTKIEEDTETLSVLGIVPTSNVENMPKIYTKHV